MSHENAGKLAMDVRQKFIETLIERNNFFPGFIGMVVSFYALDKIDAAGWVVPVTMIVCMVVAINIKQAWHRKLLEQHSDDLLQIKYDEYVKHRQQQKLVSRIFLIVVIALIAAYFIINPAGQEKMKKLIGTMTSQSICTVVSTSEV